MTVVWLAGLRGTLPPRGLAALRPIGWIFVVTFVFFLLTSGKAYYLAGAILPLLAAGCVLVAERFRRIVAVGVVLALSALVAWPAMVPVLPTRTYATSFYPAIDEDQLETIGWPEFADTVARALGTAAGRCRRVHRQLRRGRRPGVVRRRRAGLQRPQRLGRLGAAARRRRPGRGRRLPTTRRATSPAAGGSPRSREVDGADNEEAGARRLGLRRAAAPVVGDVAASWCTWTPERRLRPASPPTAGR